MPTSDELLREAKRSFSSTDSPVPRRGLAVVTCMDARIDPWRIHRADRGDLHVIRNAGAVVTDDVRRSLVVSVVVFGVRKVELMMHTDCGACGLDEEAVAAKARATTGAVPTEDLLGFDDLDAQLRDGVQELRTHPVIGAAAAVVGSIYDVARDARRVVLP